MIDISIQNMGKSYFSNPIFENVTIEIKNNERLALIGENGTGKTTLFKIICGEEKPSIGDLFIRKGIKIGYLKQVPDSYHSKTVRDVLMLSFVHLDLLKTQLSNLEVRMKKEKANIDSLLKEYAHIQTRYESEGGYSTEEKLSKICEGLGLDKDFISKEYNVLSGGEKSCVCLGKLLLEEPDVILLDEPTNHLDIQSIEWLEVFLKQFKGSVLMISHDRYFLDAVIDRIYELSPKGVEVYNGNYSYYLEERLVRLEQRLKTYNQQQRKIKQMEDAVKRFRDWGNRADSEAMYKKAQNMEKRIDRMDKMDRPDANKKGIRLNFDSDNRTGKEVIVLDQLNLKIGHRTLVKDASEVIFYQERIGLIGPNGCGKSTLIKTLLGLHSNYTGQFKLGSNAEIGYLEQDIVFENEELSLMEAYRFAFALSEGDARNELARFRFYKDDVFKRLKSLSGGERVRFRLAGLMRQDINLLILDEPTNHIDLKTKEVLEEALLTFKGTLLFISHDRYFLNVLADRILEMDQQCLRSYMGGYDQYKHKKAKTLVQPVAKVKEILGPKVSKHQKVKRKANPIKIKALEDEIALLEHDIELKNKEIQGLVTEYEKIVALDKAIKVLENDLESKLTQYYDLIDE